MTGRVALGIVAWLGITCGGVCIPAEREDQNAEQPRIDIAASKYRDSWLHHPVIGDPSFDSFERVPGNPIYTGRKPYEWPVNGYLFKDPISSFTYAYFTRYPRGYWGGNIAVGLLRSKDGQTQWENLEDTPDLLEDNKKEGCIVADPMVFFDDGKYYMIHGWGILKTDNRGMACARSDKPEGPFLRLPELLVNQPNQPLLNGIYQFIYGSTVVRRKQDFLMLSGISLPGSADSPNPGGAWALCALRSRRIEGPYAPPATILIAPQSKYYQPCPVEWFPAFTHEDYVYAPATSLGANRNFQIVYRAKIEEAHRPEAWEVFQSGSVWHSEAVENEASGIWGQTFSGFVDQGVFHVLFHCLNSRNEGTLNLARRPWDKPYRDGFALSAPAAPSLALYQRGLSEFLLRARLRCNGPKILLWNHDAPLGVDKVWHVGGASHTLTLSSCTQFALAEKGWGLRKIAMDGGITPLAGGEGVKSKGLDVDEVEVSQEREVLRISVNGALLWEGKVNAQAGSIGFLAEKGTTLFVDKLLVSTEGQPCSKFLLPTDGIAGAGNGEREWTREAHQNYKYGFGYYTVQEDRAAKWNYTGRGFAIWSPRSPQGGVCEVWCDGRKLGDFDQHAEVREASSQRFKAEDLPFGYHAVSIVRKSGVLFCDSLEFFP